MAVAGGGGADVVVVEVAEPSSSSVDEIEPLLLVNGGDDQPPRMTIFSISYPRRPRPQKEPTFRTTEPDIAILGQIVSWIWSGSRRSGMLCVASSSIIYYIMDILPDIFPVRSFPIYQTLFTRCVIILVISLLWLRRTGQPLLVPTHARNILVLRSLTGFVSVLSFIYSVQNLPMSYAVLLNSATPIMASIGAMIILKERLCLPNIGGLLCSFLSVLLILLPMPLLGGSGFIGAFLFLVSSDNKDRAKVEHETHLSWDLDSLLLTVTNPSSSHHFPEQIKCLKGTSTVTVQTEDTVTARGRNAIFSTLVGIISTTLGGLSYCLISAGAKTADQPVYTVFSFAIFACPLSAVCIVIFQEFVLGGLFTFLQNIVLGVLAFFAEILLARGLQLGKIAKVANILYIKVLLSQMWSMTFFGAAPTLNKLIGCLLVLASTCGTSYFGLEKENE